jgi:dihydropyrimidinase
MRTLIKNGTIVTAVDLYQGDVLIEDEKISVIGTSLDIPATAVDKTIDASGKYVLPGGIDVHTHMDMPFGGATSADDFETGTRAAAFGGTTTIVDFAIQYRGQTLHHAWEEWAKKAEGRAVVDYGFHMIITDLNDQVEGEMDALVRQGITSFKMFMAYPGVFMSDDGSIFKALLRTGKNGGTICMHAENGGVIDVLVQRALAEGKTAPKYHALTRPARAEAEATHRAIARWVASASARAGRVSAWYFGAVLPSASARCTRTSITPPFSACMQIVPPFLPVRSSALKMLPSSDMNTPG